MGTVTHLVQAEPICSLTKYVRRDAFKATIVLSDKVPCARININNLDFSKISNHNLDRILRQEKGQIIFVRKLGREVFHSSEVKRERGSAKMFSISVYLYLSNRLQVFLSFSSNRKAAVSF